MTGGKNKVYIVIVPVIACLLLLNAGCEKCYTCAAWRGSFNCIKTKDTVRIFEGIRLDAIDTLRYYRNMGYQCDTVGIYYDPGVYWEPVCGKRNYKAAINASAECYLN